MAIPNTTTFTLVNVCDELNLIGADRNLVKCFSSANPNYFDPAYSGSKNSLLNFRDYGSHDKPVFIITPLDIEFTIWSSSAVIFDMWVEHDSGIVASIGQPSSWISSIKESGSLTLSWFKVYLNAYPGGSTLPNPRYGSITVYLSNGSSRTLQIKQANGFYD